jgi:hypothetical protein
MTTPNDTAAQGNSNTIPLDDFLNPKSMLTPGVAGSLVMLLTNAICYNFGELQPRWVGLVLSGALGLLVFLKGTIPLWQKITFYLLNSLIIFSVGMGTANLAHTSAAQPAETAAAVGSSFSSELSELFVSTAGAQEIQTLSTNVLVTPKAPEIFIIGASNADLKLSDSNQILPLSAISNSVSSNVPVRIDYNELSRILATNRDMQMRIQELEVKASAAQATRPTPESQRPFFQKW